MVDGEAERRRTSAGLGTLLRDCDPEYGEHRHPDEHYPTVMTELLSLSRQGTVVTEQSPRVAPAERRSNSSEPGAVGHPFVSISTARTPSPRRRRSEELTPDYLVS